MVCSGMKNRLFFDLAVSISIVVLIYINLIRSLLFASGKDAFFIPDTGFYDDIVALFLIVFLAGLCFLCIQILRKINIGVLNVLASLLFFLALLNPAHFILLSFLTEPYHPDGLVYVWIMASKIEKTAIVFVFLTAVALFIRFYWRLFQVARLFTVITSPFAVLIILQLSWHALTALAVDNRQLQERRDPAAPSVSNFRQTGNAPRVLVIVFDELDYRLLFVERPTSLRLPEFDKLAEKSIQFTHVPSVSPHTLEAIPTLLVGKRVLKTTVVNQETLLLHFKDAQDGQSFSSMPNLFSQARQAGKTLSIAGSYLPYCRLFRGLYKDCLVGWRKEPPLQVPPGFDDDLWLSAQNMFLKAFPYPPYIVGAIWRYGVDLQPMKEMISRFDVDLIYLHIMLPHKPIIFNRQTGRMTPFNYSPWGYYDNLALTDKCLGEIRRTLENAGLWESTTVLVTADHPWRKAKKYTGKVDSRVPLLLKATHQQEAIVFEHEFPPMRIKDLVLRILDGHLVDLNTITTWLEQP